MKVIVFNGSPAGVNSTTNLIAEAFFKGAMSAGAEIENIFLTDCRIIQCHQVYADIMNELNTPLMSTQDYVTYIQMA